jgi:hypothetical protein
LFDGFKQIADSLLLLVDTLVVVGVTSCGDNFLFFLSWGRRVAYRAFSCLLLLVDTLVVVGVTSCGSNFLFFFELE